MGDMLRIGQGERGPVFTDLTCGGCGQRFTGNVKTVPCLQSRHDRDKPAPICAACWDALNELRVRANLPAWQRPLCYLSDYPALTSGTVPGA